MEIRKIQDTLKDVIRSSNEITTIPRNLRNAIFNMRSEIGDDVAQQLLNTLDQWKKYQTDHNVSFDNPFLVRYHLQQFAETVFSESKKRSVVLYSVDIHQLSYKEKSFKQIISSVVDSNILFEKNIAIFGGVARTALKVLAGVSIEHELPIDDVDVIARVTPGIDTKIISYGIDLAGARMTDRSLRDEMIETLSTGIDCTMNEVAIVDGKLFYSYDALGAVTAGEIKFIPKKDALFGVATVNMPDGSVYLHKTSIYRALAYLTRRKGDHFFISLENLQEELPLMSRYWVITLFVKILKMKNQKDRDVAVLNWYHLAKQLEVTDTVSPLDFLKELLDKHPEMKRLMKSQIKTETPEQQLQWLITKLCDTAVEQCFPSSVRHYPNSTSMIKISLPTSVPPMDLIPFWNYINGLKKI